MKVHPRLALLRSQVLNLPVDEQYRAALLQSIETYRGQILARPHYAPHEGWDDLEALQQVTLGDAIERTLHAQPAPRPATAMVWRSRIRTRATCSPARRRRR